MTNLKERTIGVLQRDRMAELLKLSSDQNSGCFYLALLMSWNYLFPHLLVEKKLVEHIVGSKEGLGVTPRNAISELMQRENQLNMRLTGVGITNFLDEEPVDFRENANIPKDIHVQREQYPLEHLSPNQTAIILWVGYGKNGRVGMHYTSYHASENERFAPEETVTKKSGYLPMMFLHLEAVSSKVN